MGRRTLLLIASILVAAVGTALIGLYVRGADTRAQSDATLVSVLIAGAPVEVGAEPVPVPANRTRDQLPEGYITDTSQIVGKATMRILKDQVLQKQMFGEAGATGLAGITKGHQAVSIEVADAARAAGVLTPGSVVTIYLNPAELTKPLKELQLLGRDKANRNQLTLEPRLLLPVVLPSAKVLRIGNSTGTTVATAPVQEDDVPRTIITFDLTADDAARLITATALGDMYFAVHDSAP